MRFNKLAISATSALGLLAAVPAAQAIDMTAGDWTFSVNGNVNVHYVNTQCDDQANATNFGGTVAGGTVGACNIAGPVGDDSVSQVRTGLLPSALVFTAATQQNGWDISGTFGLYPGIVSNDDGAGGGSPNIGPGGNVGLGTSELDFRQVFLKFGNANFGEVKMGRDFGLFGYDAIINDMTIPGVGVGSNAVGSPANTTLGSIGFGYIYTDTLSQINYTTPDFSGFTATAGIFQTLDPVNSALGLSNPNAAGTGESTPGFHGQLRFEWESGFVSANAVTLDVDGLANGAGGFKEENATGFDVNYKQALGPLEVLLSYYSTEGLGSVAYLFDGFDANGDPRDSDGGLAQATYTIGSNKFGVNYGVSNLDRNSNDPQNLFETNEKVTVGWYHSFTPNLTLLAEYSDATSEDHQGAEVDSENFNVGAFFAF